MALVDLTHIIDLYNHLVFVTSFWMGGTAAPFIFIIPIYFRLRAEIGCPFFSH